MGIVAGLTSQPAFAPGKTTGLPQPVYRTHRFKFVVVSGTRRMIEGNHEILEPLSRLVPRGYSWKSIVAKHALVSDEAPSPRMIGIGTRRHSPRSGVRLRVCVRIPTQRQFD